jgi:hypothetical protein
MTAGPAGAQTTGAIAGKVVDSTGGVIQKAAVTLSGPSLQGTQTATTDQYGTFRFRNVPPGADYTIVVKLTSFRDATIANPQVFLGQEGTVTVVMTPAGMTRRSQSPRHAARRRDGDHHRHQCDVESVHVAAKCEDVPAVDAAGADRVARNGQPRFAAVWQPDGRGFGAGNNYNYIDGLSATDPRYGTSGANISDELHLPKSR